MTVALTQLQTLQVEIMRLQKQAEKRAIRSRVAEILYWRGTEAPKDTPRLAPVSNRSKGRLYEFGSLLLEEWINYDDEALFDQVFRVRYEGRVVYLARAKDLLYMSPIIGYVPGPWEDAIDDILRDLTEELKFRAINARKAEMKRNAEAFGIDLPALALLQEVSQ
jgi:hypothetical protein